MKFIGTGIVWDATNNRILCKFVDGKVETDDKNVINTLVNGGYEYEGELDFDTDDDIEDDVDELENKVVVNEDEVLEENNKEETKKKSSKSKGAE